MRSGPKNRFASSRNGCVHKTSMSQWRDMSGDESQVHLCMYSLEEEKDYRVSMGIACFS